MQTEEVYWAFDHDKLQAGLRAERERILASAAALNVGPPVTLKARDTFHTSQTGTVHARSVFTAPAALGDALLARGLAEEVREEMQEPVPAPVARKRAKKA